MSLQDPSSKMSKSDPDENGYILLLDDEKAIRRKIKRAVTDSLGLVSFNEEQLGIRNLLNLYQAFTNETIDSIVGKYEGKGYGDFKEDLAEIVVEGLRPIHDKYDYLMKNKDFLEKVYREGAEKASHKAMKTLRKVYKKIGFVEK